MSACHVSLRQNPRFNLRKTGNHKLAAHEVGKNMVPEFLKGKEVRVHGNLADFRPTRG
jgi:hypothetical protein